MTDTATTEAEAVKKTVTKRDVTALLESFKPELPKAESAAEKERTRRIKAWNAAVANLASVLDSFGAIDGPPADAAAALRALGTVQKKGAATIAGISDAKLTGEVVPKAARQPRPSTARTLSAEDSKAAVERAEVPDEAVAKPEETTEEMDARIKAEREARAEEGAPAAPTQHRSGPPRSGPVAPTSTTQGDPRGDEDPNSEDGF